MNVLFKLAVWVEERRAIKKLEFEERIRPIEMALLASQRTMQILMKNASDEKPLRQEIKALRDRIDKQ